MWRWFTVTATRQVHSSGMEYDACVMIRVLARDKQDAMKRVRPEFRQWHLAVEGGQR
jgi:hypothetical protein